MKDRVIRAGGLLVLAALCALFFAGRLAHAQAYPNKPVKLIVGYSAGGVVDTTARLLAQGLQERLGQPVTVENRVGAGGNIGAQVVAQAPADGYTLLVGSSSLPSNAALGTKPDVDPGRDLTAIAPLVATPFVLVSSRAKGYGSLAQLFEAAAKNPGKLNYASNGVGALNHLLGALLTKMAKVDIVHVPYKGGSSQLRALVAGDVDFGLVSPNTGLPLLRDGRLVALAISTDARESYLPQTPTFAEAGFAGAAAQNWVAFFGPKNLPAAIRDKLEREAIAVMNSPRVMDAVKVSGGTVMTGGGAALAKLAANDKTRWQTVVAAAPQN